MVKYYLYNILFYFLGQLFRLQKSQHSGESKRRATEPYWEPLTRSPFSPLPPVGPCNRQKQMKRGKKQDKHEGINSTDTTRSDFMDTVNTSARKIKKTESEDFSLFTSFLLFSFLFINPLLLNFRSLECFAAFLMKELWFWMLKHWLLCILPNFIYSLSDKSHVYWITLRYLILACCLIFYLSVMSK